MPDLSKGEYKVPNTQCNVLRVAITLEMGNRYEGIFHLIPDEYSGRRTIKWTAIYQPEGDEQWKITGEGAMIHGNRVPNTTRFPFFMDDVANSGLIQYLRGLLCRHRGLRTDEPKIPAGQTKSVRPNLPSSFSLPGASGYTILDFGLVSSDRGIISGLASINSPKHCVDKYPWRAVNLSEGKWEITGLGALLEDGVRADNSAYPFSMDPQLNAGLTEALTQWLNKNHSDSPVAVKAASVPTAVPVVPKKVEEKPQPVRLVEPAQPTTTPTETKGSTMPPPGKTTSEIQRIFEAVYKIRETDEKTVLNGTERKDSRSRQIIALIMMETIEEKSMAQLAEYLKLEVQRFRSVVYSAKKYRDEEPDFKAEYRAVIKELGVDEPSSPTADKSRGGAGKNRSVQHHETLLSREDIVLILWKAMGMGSGDIAQALNIGRSEVEQSIGAIVLSASNGEDPIKGRFKQIGEKILQLADS